MSKLNISTLDLKYLNFNIKEFKSQGYTYYRIQKQLDKMAILGPANSLIYRMQDIYRKRIMIKFTNSKQLYPVLEKMSDFYNKKGNKVHVVCDFNPYNQI